MGGHADSIYVYLGGLATQFNNLYPILAYGEFWDKAVWGLLA